MNTPDGRRVGCTFTPEFVAGLLGTIWAPKFTADPGVDYRLEVPNASLSQRNDGTFGLYLTGLPYNPDAYTLVSKDQMRYTYGQFSELQLKSVQDRNNVTLSFDNSGIHSSIGQEILWTRDSLGRITQITDPTGRVLKYGYSAAGDLVSMQNSVGDTAGISYYSNPAHYVRSFTDARGIVVQEVKYNNENRLSGILDAAGMSTVQDYDIANQREVFADRLGNESIISLTKKEILRVSPTRWATLLRQSTTHKTCQFKSRTLVEM